MDIQQAVFHFIQIVGPIQIQELTIQNLAKGVIYSEILNLAQGVHFQIQRINKKPETWTSRLSNFKILFRALQNFYQNELKQILEKDIVDLMKISKQKDEQETLKFFGLMMGVFVRVQNKEFFIEKILQLKPQQQSSFASIIKSALKKNHISQQKQISENQYIVNQKQQLLEKLNELQEQNNAFKMQNQNVKQQNIRIKKQVAQLEKQIQYLNEQITHLKSKNFDFKIQMMNSLEEECNNTLVENLKQKLLSMSTQHEKQIINYKQEIEMMENKIDRVAELEQTTQTLQQKILNLNKKLQNQDKIKKQLEKSIEYKDYTIKKLETEIKQYKQKISKYELQIISNQIENQRKSTRNQFQSRSRITSKRDLDTTLGSSRSRLSDICPQIQDDNYKNKAQQLEQQIIIQSKRIKQLQRELSKCKLKCQKLEKLQIEKKKLEQLLVQFTNSKGLQVILLTTALYELRIRYEQLQSSNKI